VADHVHEYEPKPLPPPLYPWPIRAWSLVWIYLSWPWQVRQFKAYGFRRTGWMTWETGPGVPSSRPSRDLSTRLLKAGRLSLVFEPRDFWVGLYAGPDAVYLTLIPCLPIRWARKERP